MAQLRALFLLTCCLPLAIGPLNLLQVWAWGTMLRNYSQERSLSEAAEMTFGGEYPCEMCRKIAVARQKKSPPEHPPSQPSDEQKTLRLDFPQPDTLAATRPKWLVPLVFPGSGPSLTARVTRHSRVPTPPPQALS